MKRKRIYRQRGFTLIELMIVIVILGMLATIVMPKILNRPEDAKQKKAIADIRNIETALALFKTDTGRFPTTAENLQSLTKDPGIAGYNAEGYLDKVPVDPWGKPYVYLCPSVHGKYYDLKSLGKDGENGGTGYDADIENWNLN